MESARSPASLLRIGAGARRSPSCYIPIVLIVPLRVQRLERARAGRSTSCTTKWFSVALTTTRTCREALWLSLQGRRSARPRSRSSSAPLAVVRASTALPLLRARRRSRSCSSCRSRCPGSSPGMALQLVLHVPSGIDFGLLDDHRSATRPSASSSSTTTCVARLRRVPASLERGVDGPRRGRLADLPLRDAARDAATALLAGGAARVRALVRRGDRHHVHRRARSNTLPIWIFGNHPPRPAAAGGERRRPVRDRR